MITPPVNARSGRRRLLGRLLLAAASIVILDQVVNAVVGDDGWPLGRRIAPFDPALFTVEQQASLARLAKIADGAPQESVVRYDAELGWVSPRSEQAGDSWYDAHGARRSAPGVGEGPGRRLLLIGCSFIHGDEIGPDETFAARLAARSTDSIFNCGVGGYGIDQALLVLRREGAAIRPDEVWLGVVPKALPRLLSHYRPAMRHREPSVSFKPRFRLGTDGTLELIPNPAPTPRRAVELLTTSGALYAAIGHDDWFLARHPLAYAPYGSSLWHRSGLARLLLTAIETRDRPQLSELLADGGELAPLARAVVLATARECIGLGARFRLLVLPDAEDLASAAQGGPAAVSGLLAELRDAGIEIVDVTPFLLRAGIRGGGEPWFQPGGHYTARTAEVVAAALAASCGNH